MFLAQNRCFHRKWHRKWPK